MGKCILHFDRIHIVEKSGGAEPDNDWMIVHWFMGSNGRQMHVLPLASVAGSPLLESGDNVRPLSLEADCRDEELVTAVYRIVNLGTQDAFVQAKLAGAIAQHSGDALTRAYIEAAEFVVENNAAAPGSVFDDGSDEVRAAIRDTIVAAFEQTLAPTRGRACIGVLHDIALFPPGRPILPLHPRIKAYPANALPGGGPRTIVELTLERRLQTAPRRSEPRPAPFRPVAD